MQARPEGSEQGLLGEVRWEAGGAPVAAGSGSNDGARLRLNPKPEETA